MVRLNHEFRNRLRNRDPLIGTFLNLGSATAAEACAMAGCEFMVVDLEHGSAGEDALLEQIVAAAAHRSALSTRTTTGTRLRLSAFEGAQLYGQSLSLDAHRGAGQHRPAVHRRQAP